MIRGGPLDILGGRVSDPKKNSCKKLDQKKIQITQRPYGPVSVIMIIRANGGRNTAVLLGYDDHVTGCVLFSFYLFPVTKRLSVSKSQGIASHTICFPYISTEVCEV